MKLPVVSINLTGVTLLATLGILFFSVVPLPPPTQLTISFNSGTLQLGYYNIMADHQELYDVSFTHDDDAIIITFNHPCSVTSNCIYVDYKIIHMSNKGTT